MIIRLSQRLAKKINAGELSEMQPDANPCADWTCRLFIANRVQYIIISNTLSLYSCVMRGKGVKNRDLFVAKTLDAIGEFMTADQQQSAYQRFVAPASADVIFAKSLNRSVTGSMSDHVHSAKLYVADGLDLHEIGFRLNASPMSALTDAHGRKHGQPREVFVRLAESMPGG